MGAVPDEPASDQQVHNASYICLILEIVLKRTANGLNMLKSQEITTESSPRKKCSSTFSLQLSLLVLFVLVLALFITGVSLDVMKNYHEAFYEYNYRKTNQYYDYLPTLEKSSSPNNLRLDEQWDLDTLPSEKEPSPKKISFDDEWDLHPLKNIPMKKVKRGY